MADKSPKESKASSAEQSTAAAKTKAESPEPAASSETSEASNISPPGAPPSYPQGQPAAHDPELGDPNAGALICPVCGFRFDEGDPRL